MRRGLFVGWNRLNLRNIAIALVEKATPAGYAEDASAFARDGRMVAFFMRGELTSRLFPNQSAAISSACSSSSVLSDSLTFSPACDISSLAIKYHM